MNDQTDERGGSVLSWTARVPMVQDRFFLGDILRWACLTGIATSILLAAGFAIAGESKTFLPALGLIWIIVGALVPASLLVALLVFRNRYYVHFVLDGKAAHYLLARTTRALAQLTSGSVVTLGALLASPSVAGAGLLAATRASLRVPWTDVHRVVVHERARVISLRNRWRTLFRLRCGDDEAFSRVRAFVEAHVPAGGDR